MTSNCHPIISTSRVAILTLAAFGAFAAPVMLQQPTATFSQNGFWGDFSIGLAVDGNSSTSWAIGPAGPELLPLFPQTAAFETASDIGSPGGTQLTFTLEQSAVAYHNLGRFRISVTTDSRELFADGLAVGGDVSANWTPLAFTQATSDLGAILTVQPDLSVLVSGFEGFFDTYTLSVNTTVSGITGIRLETLGDPSLPHEGPGRQTANGNFALSELRLDAVNNVPVRSAEIRNPGFEELSGTNRTFFDSNGKLGENKFSQFSGSSTANAFDTEDAIPGWQYFGEGGAGTWNPPKFYFPADVPEGRNAGWINYGFRSGEIRQTLTNERFAAGLTYRLSAMVSVPLGVPFPGYRIEIRAGDNVLATDSSPNLIYPGLFRPVTVEFSPAATAPYLGQPIQIVLGNGPSRLSGQTTFDDVKLEVYSGPASFLTFEPSSQVFTNSILVLIKGAPPNSTILYTLDNSEPALGNGLEYVDGVHLNATASIRARAFSNFQPTVFSAAAQYVRSYVFSDVIPTSWRELYFGPFFYYDPNAIAVADADLDGTTNLREYLQGTNPIDRRSGFIINVARIPLIRWPAIIGTSYRIERRQKVETNWQIWRQVVADKEKMQLADESQTDGDAFYRVVPIP